MHEPLRQLFEAVVKGDLAGAVAAVQVALADGCPPESVLKDGMVAGMGEVGRLFENGKYFVPELLVSARAMHGALGMLRPALQEAKAEPIGRVVIGTVQGDLHDIGKNLVALMLEGGGFDVVDLGTDVHPERFARAAREHVADIVALSALLTSTMDGLPAVIDALRSAGIRERVRVMVGGAPITEAFAAAIGADGFAADGTGAVRLARHLLTIR